MGQIKEMVALVSATCSGFTQGTASLPTRQGGALPPWNGGSPGFSYNATAGSGKTTSERCTTEPFSGKYAKKGWRKRAGRRDTDTMTGRVLYGIVAHGRCGKSITLK